MRRGKFTAIACGTVVILATVLLSIASAETEKGSENIIIPAGKKAPVPFPHWQHQEVESITCQACHELFPMETNSISRLKDEGTLKARKVMNSLCISCHRETSAAGKPSGPRSCKICHAK